MSKELAERLPELPEPWQCETRMCPRLYTADQMREYAARALREAGWVKASDRLPIDAATFDGVYETVPVLAFDGARVSEVMFCAGNGCGKPWATFDAYGALSASEITHWMPLPPAPTPDQEPTQ